MKLKIFAILIMVLFLFGCQPAQEAGEQPDVETPAHIPVQDNITVEEEVIVPAHVPEPEPEPEPEEVEEPVVSGDALLTERKDTDHFHHGRPEAGDTVSSIPRKVNIIFNYPVTEGTEIEVWDADETKRYDDGDTILADTDLLVAIVYVNDMESGKIYKVKYHVVFVADEGEEDGYYYFKVE